MGSRVAARSGQCRLEPFQLERFTLEGPDTWLNASMSLQVTLALHELATNAAKYGALRNANGRVRLTWEQLDADRLNLCWRETGGPRVTTPKSKGFGSILIEHTFDGARFEYAPQGLTCTFEVTLLAARFTSIAVGSRSDPLRSIEVLQGFERQDSSPAQDFRTSFSFMRELHDSRGEALSEQIGAHR